MGNITWHGDTFTEIHHPPPQLPVTQRQYGFWTLVLVGVLSTVLGGVALDLYHRLPKNMVDAVADKAADKTSKESDSKFGPTLVPGKPFSIEQRPTPDLKLGVRVSEHP